MVSKTWPKYAVITAWGAFIGWALSITDFGASFFYFGFVRRLVGQGIGHNVDALLSGGLLALVTALCFAFVRRE